ncbi:MAG: PAS domain S-box protein [Candidatus Bathyarchaeia archaeon]
MSSFSNLSVDKINEYNTKFVSRLDEGFELLEVVTDKHGKVTDFVFLEVNPAYEKQTGLKAEDLIGKHKKEVAPASEQRWYDYAIQAIDTGKRLSYQYYNPKVNRLFETQFIPISPNQIAVLFKDLTESKKAKDALIETKKSLENIIDKSPLAFSLFDKNGFLIQVNDAWGNLWQIPPDLVIGKYNVLQSKQVAAVGLLPVVERVFSGETIKSLEMEYDPSTEPETQGFGRKRWLSITAYPIKNEFGDLNVVTLIEDITDRKRTEETLKKSEQRYRELYESFDEAFIVIDWDFNVINWNKAAERVSTVPAKEAYGKKIYSVLPEMLNVDVTPYFESLKQKKPARFMMNVVSRQTMKSSVFEISTYPSELGITIIVQDKTELEESKRLSAIGATAGMVGHDIRNPLQTVMSETYLLKEDLTAMPENKTKEDIVESLESIEKNIAYINKIVQDLQDYARPVTPEVTDANLSNVFVNIFENVKVPEKISLTVSIKEIEKIRTDPMLLQRALTNLVTNAVQAMPDGGSLEIKGQLKDNLVIITVADTGVGIPEEVKSKLFTPMMTTKAKGQGFGLAVTKRLVEALKGSISFESEAGKGSKFKITLPQ